MPHIRALASCATCRDLARAPGSKRCFSVRSSVRSLVTPEDDDENDDMRRRNGKLY